MKSEENQVSQGIEKLGAKLKESESENYSAVLKKATDGAIVPKDLMNIDDAKIESVYAQAYRYYNTGKFKEASELFRYLMMINPIEAKYTLGLAACFHLLKDYNAAAQVYLLCGILDTNSPIPGFHASDCYLQMNDKVSALVSLNMAIDKSGNRPEYQVLKDRAKLTVETLKKELQLKDEDMELLKEKK